MATIFKEVVTVNAPDQDVIFDGCDFTENGYIEITTAKSVRVVNCRFYSPEARSIVVSGETKLMVSYSYFGKDCIIDVSEALADGSTITSNYFNGGVQSIVFKKANNDTKITISNNTFKNDSDIQVLLSGAPQATFDVFGNQFETDYLMGIGCSGETETYSYTGFHFTNNIGKNPVILEGPIVGVEVPAWSDTDNYPMVFINNKVCDNIPIDPSAELIINLKWVVLNMEGDVLGRYRTLSEAYTNMPDTARLELFADDELTDTYTIEANKTIFLYLHGHTLTLNKPEARCIFNNGTLDINGGIINNINTESYGCIDNSKHNSAKLFLQDMTVYDNGNGDGAAIVDRGNGTVVIRYSKINCTNDGSKGNACCTMNSGTNVILDSNNFTCLSGSDGKSGSYPIICRGAEMHVEHCNVTGAKGGISMDYGQLYINGGTIVGEHFYGCWVTNDGVSTECHISGNPSITGNLYAVYASVDDGHQDTSDARITINSGTFVGNIKAAAAIGAKSTVRDWGMEITGGLFLMADGSPSDVSAYVKEGYIQNEYGEVVPA